jgi:hypothetical protein
MALEALDKATISFMGTYTEILFSDEDRLSTQIKEVVSLQKNRLTKFVFQSRKGTKIEWWSNGANYNPHGAAISIQNTNRLEERHHRPDGSLGCDYGPAIVTHAFGLRYQERWITGNNIRHREDGPAIIEILYSSTPRDTWSSFCNEYDIKIENSTNPTGNIITLRSQEWYRNNVQTRRDSWAAQTDSKCFERFEQIAPMGMMRTLVCGERRLEWRDEKGYLHRTDGPAVMILKNVKEVETNGRMVPWQCETWVGYWWIHDTPIPSLDIAKWAKKNHIPMMNEPCYDRSIFRRDDGEVCFITDFIGNHQ